jgi:hypothetical protein
MGDHRPKITADFEMHGHKAHYDFDWCNWSDNGDGIDQRIVDWFAEQSAIAIGKWRDEVYESQREQREAQERKGELEQLERLKAKYEPVK